MKIILKTCLKSYHLTERLLQMVQREIKTDMIPLGLYNSLCFGIKCEKQDYNVNIWRTAKGTIIGNIYKPKTI
jgi:hypothetical protein